MCDYWSRVARAGALTCSVNRNKYEEFLTAAQLKKTENDKSIDCK